MITEKQQQQLDAYLRRMELALEQISVADRSDILLEIDSHIKERLESGTMSLDEVLNALGDPVQVANRYLLSKGARPMPVKRTSWLKAITLGTLAAFSLFLIAVTLIVRSFTPVFAVDEEKGHVTILGGLIEVNEMDDKVSFGKGHIVFSDGDEHFEINSYAQELKGSVAVEGKTAIEINGKQGKWSFEPSQNKQLSYNCKLSGPDSPVNQKEIISVNSQNRLTIDLGSDRISSMKCHFTVPSKIDLNASLESGKIDMDELTQNVSAKLINGKLYFKRSPLVAYQVNTAINNGKVQKPEDETPANAVDRYSLDLRVDNGKILVE